MGKSPSYKRKRAITHMQKYLEKRYHVKFYHYGVWSTLVDKAIITGLQFEYALRNPSKQQPVDGFYTEKLAYLLPRIKEGQKNRYVCLLQCLLLKHGYPIKLDGNFQQETQRYLDAFFKDNQISANTDELSIISWHCLITHHETSRNGSFFETNVILGGKVRNGK